ncbi:AAA domain-containing protein [Sphingobacterium sp. Lzh-3]|uniref:AAA domain-containing protein n=1 Tax=unclassified Sphingobacterium TaxID=2609468 RepID=UPI002953EA63|nr:AAA domain-containing protein [Sphingobacterium sp. UGAL515B_05]WON94643.1 AAA domain-containing protein [Sphingobacterium sp. UGAL515B_05]
MNYFDELITLLRQEHQFDRLQHENLLLKSSLNERRMQGVTWFPIQITDTELGRGDYLSVNLNRTNYYEVEHKFRFGMPVCLFSNHDPDRDRIEGIISSINRDGMRISFRVDELPEWSRRGKLGVDLLFDEYSYREMFNALEKGKELSRDAKQGSFVRRLIGEELIPTESIAEFFEHPNLNTGQNKAVQQLLEASTVALLHGPPGTGKTTTLVQAVKALLKQYNKQVLVVAPSNTAVDLLTERLDAAGIAVTRIGNPVKVSEHLQELTLDAKIDRHPANKDIKTLQKQVRTYTEMAQKYKRNFGKAEREQRKALFDEAHRIRKDVDKIQDFISADVLDKSQVITATLVGSNHEVIRNRSYETVIIDEAAQALEPACWIPILKAHRVILAGDHNQLPPTVKSSNVPHHGLSHTLFEKLVDHNPQLVSLLDVQYRMNEQIMQYPSTALYNGLLRADSTVAQWSLAVDTEPVLFIDTAGAGFEETESDGAIFNLGEAHFIKAHLNDHIGAWTASLSLDESLSVGVIAPYRKQATLLKEVLDGEEVLRPFNDLIKIQTIDSFQGQEKDVIYISLTRSNAEQQIGFLSDVRRMNVAMTRAKKKLVVIGDSATIGSHPFYREFIAYTESIGHYHSVWEWDISAI